MKYLINIVAFLLLFQFSLFAQDKEQDRLNAKGPEKEKVEFRSMKEFRAYQEAVAQGKVKPLKKEEIEEWYNKLIEEIDQKYHSSSKTGYDQAAPLSSGLITTEDSPAIAADFN